MISQEGPVADESNEEEVDDVDGRENDQRSKEGTKPAEYECPPCNKIYTKSGFRNHIRVFHPVGYSTLG